MSDIESVGHEPALHFPGSVRVTEIDGRGNVVVSETHQHVTPTGSSVLVILIILAVSQLAIWCWRKYRPHSFKLVSLGALWLFPFLMSLKNGFYRFIIVWTLFTLANIHVFRTTVMTDALNAASGHKVGRQVYQWFYWTLRLCNASVAVSYFLLFVPFFGVDFASADHCVMFLFYGLYFGVLSRDSAELCTERVVQSLGFFSAKGIPRRRVPAGLCAVCNEPLLPTLQKSPVKTPLLPLVSSSSAKANATDAAIGGGLLDRRAVDGGMLRRMEERQTVSDSGGDKKSGAVVWGRNVTAAISELMRYFDKSKDVTFKLTNCDHCFHDFCIRGWMLLSGKKDMCPVCAERMHTKDSAHIFQSIWKKQEKVFGAILSILRYLIVWNPIIAVAVQGAFYLFGIETSHVVDHTIKYNLGHKPHQHIE